MSYTLGDIKDTITSELDLEDEDFIDSDEFARYVNQGIREAEAEIHKFGLEDQYFRAKADLGLTLSDGTYSPPSDMYADKILSIMYDSSDRQFEILRLRGTKTLEEFHWLRRYGTATTLYKYLLTNDTTDGRLIQLAPLSFETSSNATVWYIRRAKVLSSNSDVCDIPFEDFILQFVRDKCMNKEKYTLDAPPSAALQQQRQLMTDTLSDQVPDGHNEIEHDISHYEDSV